MASKNRFSKPVAFNHTNAEDQKILAHIEALNFSGYVKELILADIAKMDEQAKAIKVTQKTGNGGIKYVMLPR